MSECAQSNRLAPNLRHKVPFGYRVSPLISGCDGVDCPMLIRDADTDQRDTDTDQRLADPRYRYRPETPL